MGPESWLPRSVRFRTGAAPVFVGLCAAAVIATIDGVARFVVDWGDGSKAVVAAAYLAVGIVSGVLGWQVATARIRSPRALGWSVSVVLVLAYAAVLLELAVIAGKYDVMTANCFLLLVAVGVLVQIRSLFIGLVAVFSASWLVAMWLTAPPGEVRRWIVTWLATLAISVAAFVIGGAGRAAAAGLSARLRSDAWRDQLTGLLNRVGCAEKAPQLVAVARRQATCLWCAYIDVDKLKVVNDSLGHDAGDEVLFAVGRALDRTVRAADLAARWGGDEFVVLGLGDPPTDDDLERRLLDALPALPEPIATCWGARVTVGVAASSTDYSIGDLMASADRRMYERRGTRRDNRQERPSPHG